MTRSESEIAFLARLLKTLAGRARRAAQLPSSRGGLGPRDVSRRRVRRGSRRPGDPRRPAPGESRPVPAGEDPRRLRVLLPAFGEGAHHGAPRPARLPPRGENVVFRGSPGTGKTHFSIALVSSRYERASLVVLSNTTFSSRAEIFDDAVPAAAKVDRLVCHGKVIVTEHRCSRSFQSAAAQGTRTRNINERPPLDSRTPLGAGRSRSAGLCADCRSLLAAHDNGSDDRTVPVNCWENPVKGLAMTHASPTGRACGVVPKRNSHSPIPGN